MPKYMKERIEWQVKGWPKYFLGLSERTLNVLVVATLPPLSAQTIQDHIESFTTYSRHRIFVYNHYNWLRRGWKDFPWKLDLSRFDVIVIHYSTYLLSEDVDYLSSTAKQQLAGFNGLKVLFRQDEYMHIDGLIEVLRALQVDVLFSTFDEKDADRIYARPGLERLHKVRTLTGYVPEALLDRQSLPIANRPLEVGYRSRSVPYWLGGLGMEKVDIARRFSEAAAKYSLTYDISAREEDRIYGNAWINFLTSCRVVLGTESGSSVVDFTGKIRHRTEQYLADHPQATFEEVRAYCFENKEWEYDQAQISPRCFEAAALRTGMVLYEGKYSGFLEPWRHYVPLRKDFSNIDDVVHAIKDVGFLQQLVDRTYLEVARNPRGSYKSFVTGFDNLIEKQVHARETVIAARGYKPHEFRFVTGQSRNLSEGWSFSIMWLVPWLAEELRHARREARIPLRTRIPLTVTSHLSFQERWHLQRVVEADPMTSVVTALDGQPLPQSFSLQVLRKSILQLLRIKWGSEDQYPSEFEVMFFRGNELVRRDKILANQTSTTELCTDSLVCDRVEVIISAFVGPARLVVRQIEALGFTTPPLGKRLWRKLPVEVRFIFNHIWRSTFRVVKKWLSTSTTD